MKGSTFSKMLYLDVVSGLKMPALGYGTWQVSKYIICIIAACSQGLNKFYERAVVFAYSLNFLQQIFSIKGNCCVSLQHILDLLANIICCALMHLSNSHSLRVFTAFIKILEFQGK